MAKSIRTSQRELAELSQLMAVRGLGLRRARILREAGIGDLAALVEASKKRLTKLFPKTKGGELKLWKKQAKRIRLPAAEPVVEERPEPEPAEPAVEERPEPEPAAPVAEAEAIPAPAPTHDLTAIPGIGPARVRVLNEAGISDFRTLTRASVVCLQKLFPRVGGDDLIQWKREARKGLARNRTARLMRDRGDLI